MEIKICQVHLASVTMCTVSTLFPAGSFIDDCKTNVQVSLFRANFGKCFVSGHDFSRAERASRTRALAPSALFPSQFGFGSVRQLNLRGGHYLCSIQ